MESTESKTRTYPEAKIVLYQPKLYQVDCEVVTDFGEWIDELVDVMRGTMYAHNGVGLAAPQVGVFKRIAIVQLVEDRTKPPFVMINPAIVNTASSDVAREGCLSIPGNYTRHPVRRASRIKVAFQDVVGKTQQLELSGMMARAVQHEVDHLDGKFFIHRISGLKRDMVLRNYKKHFELVQQTALMCAYRIDFDVKESKFVPTDDPKKFGVHQTGQQPEDALRSIGL